MFLKSIADELRADIFEKNFVIESSFQMNEITSATVQVMEDTIIRLEFVLCNYLIDHGVHIQTPYG